MLEARDIDKYYSNGKEKLSVLKGVTLKISEGEIAAIVGPSGAGKSTLLHILGLLDSPDSGTYSLYGREISKLNEIERAAVRNEEIGFVFQMFNLLPRLSARENTALPLVYTPAHLRAHFHSPEEVLNKLGLSERMNHTPSQLSGGQQQRVAIARAILKKPAFLLADEPTGNLDSKTAREIIGILKDLNSSGVTIVMITHEENLAREARRIVKLLDGEIVSDKVTGKAESLSVPVPRRKQIHRHKFGFYQLRDYFLQSWHALLSNRTRSFLSILGVLIGVAAVIAMLALGSGAQEDIKKRFAAFGANVLSVRADRQMWRSLSFSGGSLPQFTAEDANLARKIDLVKRVSPVESSSAQVIYENKNRSTTVVGALPEYEQMRTLTPVSGRFFTDGENRSRERVALLGKTVYENLFDEGVRPLGKYIKINRISFKVIGLLPEKGSSGWRDNDDQIVIPLNTAMNRLTGKKYVDQIEVEVKSEEDIPVAQSALRRIYAKKQRLEGEKEEMIEVRNWAEMQEAASSTAKTFAWLLGSIALISLLVGGIGIMNIMLVSVTERTREIGLRKAIGANDRDIMAQFVIEALVVCLLGGFLGILLGSGISFGLSKFAGWNTRVSVGAVLLAVFFSVFVGLFFGLWPAKKASRLNPIDALRYE